MKPSMIEFRPHVASFRSGADTPTAYLERCLATIVATEPAVGAFVTLDASGARAQAADATARWKAGKPLSAIDGMPVGIKDIIETADMPTQMGSPLYDGWRSERDAASVFALREAGAVVLGKTVTTEFATPPPRGTRNPWDPSRTPGGSSSGSAAAVAAGMSPAALGTQGIGSIIRPASYCGCIGFKPTIGAVNRGGSHDGVSQSAHGVLAASLEDAWLTLRAIVDRIGGDAGSPGLDGPSAPPEPRRPGRLVLLHTPGWAEAHPLAKAALQRHLVRLREAGTAVLEPDVHPVVRAVVRGLKLTYDKPEAALAVAKREFPTMAEADLKATLDRSFADAIWSRDGMISAQSWKTGEAVVRDAGILKQDVPYDHVIDMQFVKGVAGAGGK